MFFPYKKLDPVIRLKIKEKQNIKIPVIISLKEPLSNRFKNIISKKRGKLKYEYSYINSYSAELTSDTIDKFSELPEVLFISYDRKANICMNNVLNIVGADIAYEYSLSGRNVNVAIIDTGVFPHEDLMRPYRVITHFKDYINSISEPYDDNGHGTFLSGVIAGSGSKSEGRYRGLCKSSKIVMLKAFNSVGEGSFSDILAAIGWVIENKDKYKIKILCLPFGAETIVSYKLDPLCMAARAAWDLGLIVVAPSGNKGPYEGTITTPGVEPSIITVGCCDCPDGNIKNWEVADFSSRGSKNIQKPEIIAPGTNITSISLNKDYCSMSGSSVSTAITAGLIALLLEKMPDISGSDLKGVLKLSSKTINENKNAQGHGVINIKDI